MERAGFLQGQDQRARVEARDKPMIFLTISGDMNWARPLRDKADTSIAGWI
jgi:hypothetical protein